MAITYHAGRRIQGLERTGSTITYEPDLSSSSGWALTNGGGTASIANNEVTLTANSNADNPIATYDLGATLSDTAWVMTFKLVYSGLENSATGQGVIYGVGLGSSATTTDLDGWNTAGMSFIEYDFRAHASTSVVQPTISGGNSSGRTETAGSTIADPYSATQYVKLYRLTSTTARMEFYLQSDYSDTPVTLNVTMANTPSGLQYVFLRLFYQNVSNSNTIVASEFKIYNGITSVVASAGDVKPTNIQVGSRFEETDTRKMYYYEPTLSLTELKAYYKFNNVSGNLVNQAASVGSSSSNSVDMVNTNVTLNETGLFGKSYLYSATDTSNDGSASTNWQFTYGSGAAFTVVTWYKQTVATEIEQCPIFDTSDSGNGLGSLLKVNGSNGNRQVTCKLHNGSVSETISTATGTFPSDTNWHFIALRATLNGSLKVTIDASTTTLTSSNAGADGTAHNRMGIGNIYRSTNIACRGNLDELSFWNRILTDAEITLLYNAGSGKEISTTWSELGT